MVISVVIFGWVSVLIFFIILFTYKKLIDNNEYAFLHILMAFMYSLWLPLPVTLFYVTDSQVLLIGTIFGLAYISMLIISLSLQTGHIIFLLKQNKDNAISEQHGSYMMATLSNPFEGLLGIFKSIWAFYLALTFWASEEPMFASLMTIHSLLFFYYLFIVLDASLIRRIKLISRVKSNPFVVNLETLIFFLILMVYVTFN
jgi:hypothetical protein